MMEGTNRDVMDAYKYANMRAVELVIRGRGEVERVSCAVETLLCHMP